MTNPENVADVKADLKADAGKNLRQQIAEVFQPHPHSTEPVPNPGTAGVDRQPQREKRPIPDQQRLDEALIEYLVKVEGYSRPNAESELARDRDSVAERERVYDEEQRIKARVQERQVDREHERQAERQVDRERERQLRR